MATVATEGWDLIAAANQSLLDTLLTAAYNDNIFPHDVNITELGITFNGTLGIPTVDLNPTGGQGTNSMASIIVPISGTLTVSGTDNIIPPDSTLNITANLLYVSIQINGTEAMQLYLDLQSSLAVYSVSIQPSQSWVALLNGIIQYYFQNEFTGGSYYLGTINMAGAPPELLPTGSVYFATQVNATKPTANILAMVANTSTGSQGILDFTNNPALLPDSQNAALYISNRCLLNNMLLPVLVKQLDTTDSSFNITGNATTPYTLSLNTSIDISAEYDPSLTSMNVYVNDSEQIQTDYGATGYPISWMHSIIWVDITGNIYLTPSLSSQTITFAVDTPDGDGSMHLSVGGWIIVGALIIATFGSLSAALAAVVAIVVPIIITQLNLSVNMSAVAGDIDQATVSFNWPAQQICPVNSIALPGDLILYVDPQV